ncbi:MAG: RluA family pseudouridine synthase [Oscillospiraceae bacterium]|nr:RluA family pseudouridine synthase [Oscillospiraceae bacterium]
MKLSCIAQREAKLLPILRQELAMSSTLVKRLKYCHAFLVNGQSARTNFIVKPGDLVEVLLDEAPPEYPVEDGELSILYEDEFLIAIDKPPGLLMHPSPARNSGTLANYLQGYYHRTGQHCLVHPVSRLDRDTFGVVLLAKNAHAHGKMHVQLLEGGLEKCYHAIVLGCPEGESGIIDAPIARLSPESLLRCVRMDGKPARTAYRLLEQKQGCSHLELRPLTGRTHQLRVHCAHMGFPIVGDPQYGSDPYGLPYQQLCAVRLGFTHPITEKFMEISSKQKVSLDFLETHGV